jgi:hypothetical protein
MIGLERRTYLTQTGPWVQPAPGLQCGQSTNSLRLRQGLLLDFDKACRSLFRFCQPVCLHFFQQ